MYALTNLSFLLAGVITTSPIQQLPFETLARVFNTLVSSVSSSPITDREPNNQPLPISQTCTYWRDIAVASSLLWTDIDSRRCPSLNALYIERSRDMPLTVIAALNCKQEFCDSLKDSMSRVRHIRTDDPNGHEHINTPLAMFLEQALCIESLVIRRSLVVSWPDDVALIDFSSYTSLKVLHLDVYTRLPSYLPKPTSLTHLSLRCEMRDNHTFVSNALDFLKHTPLLEVLSLECLEGICDAYSNSARTTVRLPRLQYLSMTTTPDNSFSTLLIPLVIPRETVVNFRDPEGEDFDRGLFSLFPPSARSPEFLQDTTAIHIKQLRSELGPMVLTAGNADSTFCVQLDSQHITGGILYHTICTLPMNDPFQAAQIRELWLGPGLQCSYYTSTAFCTPENSGWRQLFSALGSLEQLSLPYDMDCDVTKFLDALLPTSSSETGRVPCPRLHIIHFFLSFPNDAYAVHDLLKRRFELGYPVRYLHIHACESSIDVSMFNPKRSAWASSTSDMSGQQKICTVTEDVGLDSTYEYVSDVTYDNCGEEILDQIGRIAMIRSRLRKWEAL